MQKIGPNGDGRSAVATPEGSSRRKKLFGFEANQPAITPTAEPLNNYIASQKFIVDTPWTSQCWRLVVLYI